MTWHEVTGPADVKLYWEYSGQSKTIIPSSYFYKPTYAASSPLQFTINCPAGASKITVGGYPECQSVCGDAARFGTEV